MCCVRVNARIGSSNRSGRRCESAASTSKGAREMRKGLLLVLAFGAAVLVVVAKTSTVVGNGLMTPPDNIGPKTFGGKSYRDLAAAGVHSLSDGATVFAGQRDDPFFGDIGAVFDLVAIRYGTGATGGGKDFLAGYAVHSIELQLPISQLDNGGNHIVGVWAATDRQK